MADVNFNPALLNPNLTLASQILGQQEGQAGIAQTQAATQGQQLQNAQAAYNLKWLMGMDQASKGGGQAIATPQGSAAEDQSGVDQAGNIDKGVVASHVDGQFQQGQYIPSPQTAAFNAAAAAHGFPQIGAARIAQEKAAWDGQMQQRQIGANAELQQVYSLQDAVKAGNGITALRDIPNGGAEAAAHLEAKAKELGWDDKTLNAHVGDWADAVGGAVFRHTGREISDNNGTPYDKQAGRPVPGGAQAPLSAQQRVDLSKTLDAPGDVDLGNGRTATNVPLWKRLRYPTRGAAETAYANNPGALQAAQQGGGAPAAKPQAQPTAAPAPSNAAPQATAAGTPQGVAAAQAAAAKAPEALNQYGVPNKAFVDPAFKAQVPQAPPGQKLSDSDQQQIKQYNDNKDGLQKEGDELAGASAKSLQYFSAAKQILDAPDARSLQGLPGSIAAELNKLGFNLNSGNGRAEAAKHLTNAAIAGLRPMYGGGRIAAFDVKVNIEQTFPNIKEMGLGAAQNLVNENIRAAQYDLASFKRVTPYLNAGGDPNAFRRWNEQYAPRYQAVNDKKFNEGDIAHDPVNNVTARYTGGQWIPITATNAGQIQR